MRNLLAAFFCLCSVTAAVASASDTPTSDSTTVLRFPQDRSLGVVLVRDRHFGEGEAASVDRIVMGWERFSEAKGIVRIPSDKEVGLLISGKEGASDLSPLMGFPPDTISYLNLRYTDVNDRQMKYVGHLTGVRALDLTRTQVTDAGLKHVQELRLLEWLCLAQTEITDQGLAHLSSSTLMRKLILDGTDVTDGGMAYLQAMVNLRELRLNGTRVADRGLEHLGNLPSLEYLALPKEITDEGLKYVSAIASLRQLHFDPSLETKVTDAGLVHLKRLKNLETLNIIDRFITDEGLVHVAQIKTLTDLWIQLCPVTDAGLATISSLPALRHVHLSGIEMTADGLRYLSKLPGLVDLYIMERRAGRLDLKYLGLLTSLKELEIETRQPVNADSSAFQGMKHLEDLTLSGWRLTDQDLAHLANLDSLERLSLEGTDITDNGLKQLSKLKNLRYFYLDSPTISADQIAALQAEIPGLEIIHRPRVLVNARPPTIGEMAPDFEIKLLDGRTWRLRDQRGKAVFIYFWATWCAPCVSSTSAIKQLYTDLAAAYGDRFTMISLSLDEQDSRPRRHAEKHQLEWPQARIGLDSPVRQSYGVRGVPSYVVVGPDGKVASTSRDWKELRSAIESTLSKFN